MHAGKERFLLGACCWKNATTPASTCCLRQAQSISDFAVCLCALRCKKTAQQCPAVLRTKGNARRIRHIRSCARHPIRARHGAQRRHYCAACSADRLKPRTSATRDTATKPRADISNAPPVEHHFEHESTTHIGQQQCCKTAERECQCRSAAPAAPVAAQQQHTEQ